MTLVDARLLYDSEQVGSAVGARSLVGADRSLLFSAGPMVVDLVVYAGGEDMRVVHGQVVHRSDESPVPGARVRLGALGDAVETDEFGQFHLSTLFPFERAVLSIEAVHGGVRCTIPAGCGTNGAGR